MLSKKVMKLKNIVLLIICIVIIGIVIVSKTNKKKKKLDRQTQQAEDKLREAYLDKAILNPQAKTGVKSIEAVSPYAVSYDASSIEHISEKDKTSEKGNSKLMLQITENGELSARKYMLDPEMGINIGSGNTNNHIVIFDKTVEHVQCSIVSREHRVYIRNTTGDGNVILIRKNKRAQIKNKPVELISNDAILLGETLLRVEFIYVRIS